MTSIINSLSRAKRFLRKHSTPVPSQKDLEDAISHADIYGDQGWTVSDFDLKFLGFLSLNDLRQYDDIDSWLDLLPEDNKEELDSFRGSQWAERAKKWLDEEKIPPVIIITAPIVSEYELHTQIGDGRGRINLASLFNIDKIPTYHMIWKHTLPTPEE